MLVYGCQKPWPLLWQYHTAIFCAGCLLLQPLIERKREKKRWKKEGRQGGRKEREGRREGERKRERDNVCRCERERGKQGGWEKEDIVCVRGKEREGVRKREEERES